MSTSPDPTLVLMRRGRSSEPAPLDQLPVWTLDLGATAETGDPPTGLDALLGGLNPEQLRAVTHGEGPLLVVAGAGTGKTQVITRRIAWLVATRRAAPSEILALTFTDKAAEEMAVRVDQLVPYGFTDTAVSTFHAFGDRLIREFAFEAGLPTDLRVLTRPEVVIFLREHLFAFDLDLYRPLGDPTRFLSALAGHFSRCKDEDIAPEAYVAEAERRVAAAGDEAAAEDAARQLELARAYARYQELLAENGCIDFGDQVALPLRLLRRSPSIRARVARRFRYILVDEFQDTNRAQAELVALIAEEHRNITVVGDDDQSIYRFRGAAISNILEFRGRYRGARTVVLRRNYRSRAPILEAAHRLVRFNDPDRLEARGGFSKVLRAERAMPDPAPVRHEAFATGTDEADWIAGEIARRIADGARPRDHAVLVRANADADPVIRSLNMAAVPWRFSGTSGLYSRPEVRLLLAFLRAIADLGSSVDVYALAASHVYGLGGEDLTAIVSGARRRNRTLWEVLEELDRQPGILRVADATRAAVKRLVGDLRTYAAMAHERSAGHVLYAFLRDTGELARLANPDGQGDEAVQNIARFFEIVRGQSALLVDDRAAFLARHLATLIAAGDDPATADLDPGVDAVAVLTVHKAKGLEFPVVFVPGLVAGKFPAAGRRDPLEIPDELVREILPTGDARMQEERRLCYVAMTRARDELILSHAVDYGGARARRVSPFVIEALDLPVAEAAAGLGVGAPAAAERIAAFATADRVVPAARAGHATPATPLALSYSAIDAYLTCPQRYRYSHVQRVPVAPHHSMIYGAALHAAVQEFHRRHARGDVMSEADLVASFEAAWTNEGFLSREHEDARLEAGRAALRRFREDQLRPEARIPNAVEREFTFHLDGVRLRGRWDRIDIEAATDGDGGAAGADTSADPAGDATPAVGTAGDGAEIRADVVEPTLELLGRERVTITDYKTSDVRDPAVARKRARESLQLDIYAMAWEATSGRLPDAVALHFLDTGVVGRADVDAKRIAKARSRIATVAAGIRAEAFEATPSRMACGYCPFREICPASAAT